MVQGAKKYVTKPAATNHAKANASKKVAAANRRGARDIAPKKAVAVMDQLVTRKLEKAIRGHIETQMKEKSGIKVFHVLAPVKGGDKKDAGKKSKKVAGTGKIIRDQAAHAEKAAKGPAGAAAKTAHSASAVKSVAKAIAAEVAAADAAQAELNSGSDSDDDDDE